MAEMPAIDIRADLWPLVRDVLRRHVPEYEVCAFGSRVAGRVKRYSDLDLAVISHKPSSLAVIADLAEDLSESDLPWRVDLVSWLATSKTFRIIIERSKVVVQRAGHS